VYKPCLIDGKCLYVSGHGPVQDDKSLFIGRIGVDLNQEAGKLTAQQVGLTILATIQAQVNGKGESLFGSAFQQLMPAYHDLPAAGRCLLVRHNHRFNQFGLKSEWLAFNPSLAHYLGWQLDPARLFAWQTPHAGRGASRIGLLDGRKFGYASLPAR
jgi:hypothetical protein